MSRRPVLSALLLAALLPAAGCIGKDDVPGDEDVEDQGLDDASTNQSAELPDGRGESAGILETNKTEEGVGGVDHKHDYWKGKEQVVLFDRTVFMTSTPVYPDGEGSQPKSVAYVKLGALPDGSGESALVYEGANKISVQASSPTLHGECEIFDCDELSSPGAPHPSPPALAIQYRSAADADWRDPIALPYDTAVEIAVASQETDMPHSVSSLWVFRITTDRPDELGFMFTVTAFRGGNVVDWPGHPDFYADSNVRKVMEQHVTTHMSGIQEGMLYDSGGTWATPERLISWGTTKLHVIINITRASNAYNADATGFFLEVHNATYIGPEIRFGDRYSDKDGENDLMTYEFEVPVDEAGMDGPYQPASRWGFRAMATFQNVEIPGVGGLGLCPGCFPYDIEYDIVVLAIRDPEAGTA